MSQSDSLPLQGGFDCASAIGLRQVVSGSAADTALAAVAATATKPSSGVMETFKHKFARFIFGGVGDENGTINYQVIAWFAFEKAALVTWIGFVIAKGVATLGTLALPTNIQATGKFADGLTNTLNVTGSVLTNPGDNGIAQLVVPTFGSALLQVQTDLAANATKADVLGQPCDN